VKFFPGATVFLFEPGMAYTDEMQATLDSQHGLKHFPIAIGESDGLVTFHVHPDPQGSTTVDWQEGNFATPTTVPMRTIDSLIKEGAIPVPNLIKMDNQAGELAALKGAIGTLPSVRILHLETWIMQAYGARPRCSWILWYFCDRCVSGSPTWERNSERTPVRSIRSMHPS
jgi:FkbM family methyltransferase